MLSPDGPSRLLHVGAGQVPTAAKTSILRDVDQFVMSLPLGTGPGEGWRARVQDAEQSSSDMRRQGRSGALIEVHPVAGVYNLLPALPLTFCM